MGLEGNQLKAGMLTSVGGLAGEVVRPKGHGYTLGKNINYLNNWAEVVDASHGDEG